MKTTQRKWTPALQGRGYLSPAYEDRCLKTEYNRALVEAKKLCALLGKGWKPRVLENIGWHYSASNEDGRISVSPIPGFGYHAFLSEPGTFSCRGRWAENGKTAKSAVRNVVRKAKADLAKMNALLAGL